MLLRVGQRALGSALALELSLHIAIAWGKVVNIV